MSAETEQKPVNIVLFSTLFPHRGEPTLGVFVRNRLLELLKTGQVQATVIAPVPWFPLKGRIFGAYGRSAMADKEEQLGNLKVFHPRYLVVPKVGMMLTPFTLAWAAKRLLRKLLKQGLKVDLIDAHYLYPDTVSAAKLSDWSGIPFVATARGSDVSQIGKMSKPKAMILECCSKASHVITVSQSLNDLLQQMGVDADNITTLRNGVDLERFKRMPNARPAVCAETELDPNKPIVVFAGWLIPRKRVDILIDALRHSKNTQALIVGDGPLRTELELQAAEAELAHRVAFVGKKKPDEIVKYFSAADLLCLPSEREGWANVMLEAMACGVPVVARAVDGALELITTKIAGRLVDGSKPEAYAEAFASILTSNHDPEHVRAFAEKFDWQATTNGQLKIFRRAVALDDRLGEQKAEQAL